MRKFSFLFVLLPFFCISYAGKIKTLVIPSTAMHKSPSAIIVLPEAYFENDTTKFPVVYLLHGWSGGYKDWSAHTDLGQLADRYLFIIVCPDGGYAGWYLDSPLDSTSRYETYITSEVLNYIDKKYRTFDNRNGRALCGLSMGGHGAVSLLARYPDLFGMAGSMSGVMELDSYTSKYGLEELLGPIDKFPDRWKKQSCTFLAHRLQDVNIRLLIDCGTDDRFIESNRKLHDILLNLKIDHTYIERPGGHSWKYWIDALEDHLRFFQKNRRKPGELDQEKRQ